MDAWASERTTDPRVADSFSDYADLVHGTWLYDIGGPVWCEPVHGRVFNRNGRALLRWHAYWETYNPPMGESAKAYVAGRRQGSTHVPTAVTLRQPVELNYWHFHDDVLSRLVDVDAYGIDANVPVVISPLLAASAFFKEASRRGQLRDRNWLVHDRPLRCDRLIVAVHGPFRDDTPVGLQHLLGSGPTGDGQRVFLTRAAHRGRALVNEAEVRSVLLGAGFEPVDTDKLTVEEQIRLFAGAAVVVAIHGAGLTNLIHRAGAPARVVEIFPSDQIHIHFAWLARTVGFDWTAVVGSALHDGLFTVPIEKLQAAI